MTVGGVFAQNKPKTLKELIAEEKAQKEREKAEREANKQNKPTPAPSRKGGEKDFFR